jgi:hypothetical protein
METLPIFHVGMWCAVEWGKWNSGLIVEKKSLVYNALKSDLFHSATSVLC